MSGFGNAISGCSILLCMHDHNTIEARVRREENITLKECK